MTSGRTILITGGTGALGGAVTRRFVSDGWRVAVTYLVEGERDRLLEEVGDEVVTVQVDVTDPTSIEAALEEVRSSSGPVDALVHLVGGWKGGESVASHSLETWERMLRLNLLSAFLCCRAVLPSMLERDWGRIVVVATRTAREGPRDGQAAYAVAKAGVAVLAETIAEETRGTRVTANVVAPSMIDTAANRASMPDADHASWVPAEDLAAAISFLCSEEAGQLRGAWLPVYGSA